MQLTYAAAIAALGATVSAGVADVSFNFNQTCDDSKPLARVINRCPYTVYAWSVATGSRYDCDLGSPAVIAPGGTYQENYRTPASGGISIKLTKDKQCKHGSITQLEYHIENNNPGFNFNSLDVSYVDCQNDDCPTRQEGYYLQSGNENGKYATAGADKAICPILSCTDKASCNKCSYVDPDDVQTKTCDNGANLYFYMCGGEKPGSEPQTPASSSKAAPAPSSTSTKEAPKPSSTYVPEVKADAVTPTKSTAEKPHAVKTEYVYETVYVKRHAHGRRHQQFHA